MSKNKRVPSVLQKYVVCVLDKKKGGGIRETFQYFQTQREAKAWAKDKEGKKKLFRIDYDFYGELE